MVARRYIMRGVYSQEMPVRSIRHRTSAFTSFRKPGLLYMFMLGRFQIELQRRVVRGLVSPLRTVAHFRRSNREFRTMWVLYLILHGNERMASSAIGKETSRIGVADTTPISPPTKPVQETEPRRPWGAVETADFRHGSRMFHRWSRHTMQKISQLDGWLVGASGSWF